MLENLSNLNGAIERRDYLIREGDEMIAAAKDSLKPRFIRPSRRRILKRNIESLREQQVNDRRERQTLSRMAAIIA